MSKERLICKGKVVKGIVPISKGHYSIKFEDGTRTTAIASQICVEGYERDEHGNLRRVN